jgi:hypothetical protein
MNKQVYINLPVKDLAASIAFYEKLGFTKNPIFSDENASAMQWSEDIVVMLLTHDFYKRFIGEKSVIDAKTTSGVLLAINFDSKEEVTHFAETAKANGGDYFRVDMGVSEDQMFGYEVLDPDGNQWEAMWMSADFTPSDESEGKV